MTLAGIRAEAHHHRLGSRSAIIDCYHVRTDKNSGMDAVEDSAPHPVMVERRRVDRELGLDKLGPRLVKRVTIGE